MAEQMKNMNSNVKTLSGKVDELESKPAKRWDNVVSAVISLVVGAIIGAILSGAGL